MVKGVCNGIGNKFSLGLRDAHETKDGASWGAHGSHRMETVKIINEDYDFQEERGSCSISHINDQYTMDVIANREGYFFWMYASLFFFLVRGGGLFGGGGEGWVHLPISCLWQDQTRVHILQGQDYGQLSSRLACDVCISKHCNDWLNVVVDQFETRCYDGLGSPKSFWNLHLASSHVKDFH